MHEEIADHKLQAKMKKAILRNKNDQKLLLSFLGCGAKVIKQFGVAPAVFLLSNEKKSTFYGHTTCKNAWGCPVCSAKMMSRYATEIACAIDAVKKYENQVACMITFTIPHTSGMSCTETTEILYQTWKDFIVRGNKNITSSYYTKDGRKFGDKGNDPFASFCEHFNCKHRVRVGEYTWGEHGWHPHFHCLFWVDPAKLNEVKDWEDILCERWLKLAKKNTIRYWDKRAVVSNYKGKVGDGLGKADEVPEAIRKGVDDAKKNNRTRAEIMYNRLNEGSKAVYVSVDANGSVIEQKSSSYICGWGADRELTGNFQDKATKEGHLTPRQILEKATLEPDDKYMNLYLEFLRTIKLKKHMRINFSTRSGVKKLIAKWKLTNDYMEVLKKKVTTNPNTNMRVVSWFNEQQWFQICYAETNIDANIKSTLLLLARLSDGKKQIEEYLSKFGIDITKNKTHHCEDHINNIFQNLVAA